MPSKSNGIKIVGKPETHTILKNTISAEFEKYRQYFESMADIKSPVSNVCIAIEDSKEGVKGLYITGETEKGFVILKFVKCGKMEIEADARVIFKNELEELELDTEIENVYAAFDCETNRRATGSEVAAVMRCYLSAELQYRLMSASVIASHLGDASNFFVSELLELIV